jgi:hypothetical protein
MPFPNALKEPLWRAAVNATPGSHFSPWVCPCCTPHPPVANPRSHTLWDCPAALAVRQAISAAGVPPPLLTRDSVWLLRTPPLPSLSPAIWLAVCSAAVDAMDHARRVSWALRLSPVGPTPPAGVPVTQLAVARFWCNLVDIADAQPPALQRLPPGALFFALGASGSATALVPEAVALE